MHTDTDNRQKSQLGTNRFYSFFLVYFQGTLYTLKFFLPTCPY